MNKEISNLCTEAEATAEILGHAIQWYPLMDAGKLRFGRCMYCRKLIVACLTRNAVYGAASFDPCKENE